MRIKKQEKRREFRLKKFWRPSKAISSDESSEDPSTLKPIINEPHLAESCNQTTKVTCSLPLLQVWPSQDSPRGEADGQSFVFPIIGEDQAHSSTSVLHNCTTSFSRRRSSLLYCDTLHTGGDSGIESIQASPSPNALPCPPGDCSSANVSPVTSPSAGSPNPSIGKIRRKSSALLHPDHARLFALRNHHLHSSSDQISIEETIEFNSSDKENFNYPSVQTCTASSSTSSLTSITALGLGSSQTQQRTSDPWLQSLPSDKDSDKRRRSSVMTTRYSLFDTLDMEYALLRAAARGSVGPYSLSESIHKLTFTQSLAFPALARGLASKRSRSATQRSSRPLNPNESGISTCAKLLTAITLVTISFLVFFMVFKFVKT